MNEDKKVKDKQKKYCYDGKPLDVLKTKPVILVRPKAVYSNKRIYDLI